LAATRAFSAAVPQKHTRDTSQHGGLLTEEVDVLIASNVAHCFETFFGAVWNGDLLFGEVVALANAPLHVWLLAAFGEQVAVIF